MKKVLRELIGYFYPIIIILLLLLFKYINFTQLVVGYLIYCTFVYFTTKTYLFYIKTQFNIDLLENCPSIKKPNFKQYFLLPFTFCQFVLLELSSNPKKNNDNEIIFREEKIDNEGTSIFWAEYENSQNIHSNPVLFIMPGITGQYYDSYVQNIISEGLNNNFDVVVFQMRTLSSEMKMPKNKFVDFYEDINNSLIKVRNKNKNCIYGVGYSYGANLLTGYLGNKNLETNYIEGGVAVSNPFDLYMSQRLGEDTLFESLITYFERKNYIKAVRSFNRKIKNKKKCINVDTLMSSYYVKNFDTEFFGKILGYKNGDEYYRGISSAKYIKNINKPLLVIHSKDDPICTYKGIPMDDVCENENIIFILTEKGGHSCFIENDKDFSFSPRQWMFKPAFEFVNYLKNKAKKY
jgi:predicted alpha/beta-fold hydrolase